MKLTDNPQADNPHVRWAPDWSPDGNFIAFESNEGFEAGCNCTSIYVIDAGGTELRRVTSRTGGLDAGPDWSPNGRWIVFARQELTEESPYPDIWKVKAHGRADEKRLTDNRAYEWAPSWSPDGTHIMFQSNRRDPDARFSLFVMRADGAGVSRVTRSQGWDDSQPEWSASGRRIIFARDPDGSPFGFGCFGGVETCVVQFGPQPADLWIARADGSHPRVVTETPFDEGGPNLLSVTREAP
jgi:Tol biopolymer transport system component